MAARRLLLALLVAAGLLIVGWGGAARALAQGTTAPQIDNATLRLWPEYDDPGLLVILDGTFVTGTAKFPLNVSFPVAASPRGVQTTEKTAAGQLITQPWQMNGDQLTYSLPGPSFQVEYYTDRPPAANGQRTLEYTFKAPYAIRQLAIDVQQPARSSAFSVTPRRRAPRPAPTV